LTRQKDFIKVAGVFALLLCLSAFAFADTIVVVPGDSNNTTPLDTNTPTTNVVNCPAGYDCIQAEDYTAFIASLKTFTAEIGERTEFINAVFDRFDKKISLDENTISHLVAITSNAQQQEAILQQKFGELEHQKLAYEATTDIKIKNLEIQVSELKATEIWRFIAVFVLALLLAELIGRVRAHKKFIWKRIQEVLPFKFG
jgi:hypothetical protein